MYMSLERKLTYTKFHSDYFRGIRVVMKIIASIYIHICSSILNIIRNTSIKMSEGIDQLKAGRSALTFIRTIM